MGSDKHILVVEDDPVTRGAMKMVLEWEGYAVSSAANGRDALNALRRPGPKPDLILLDLCMPVLDGEGFRREQLRDPALADIPVVLVTGQDPGAPPDACAHLLKPFQPDELLEAIHRSA